MSSRPQYRRTTAPAYRRPAYARPAYSRPAYSRPAQSAPRPSTRYVQRYKRRTYNSSSSGISRQVGKFGGAALGAYLGGPQGAALGSAVGSKAGDLFASITGMGDYKVSYNTVANPQQTPSFKTKGRSVFISHREYIQDIITSPTAGAFQIRSHDLNPALASTFPWLATIAQNFEQYRIHGMVFHFKSNSADALNSVNTALGTVILATQYNILLPAFKNKQEMENYEFGCSTRPSADVLHPVECDPKVTSFGPIFDIKLGGNDKGDDRLYCPGRFSIATVGQQGVSVNIGELWVTYDIEFFKPRMGDTASQMDHWRVLNSGTFSSTSPFGLDSQRVYSESSDFETCNVSDNSIFWDTNFTGKVHITAVWKPPTDATVVGPLSVPDWSYTGGCSPFPLFQGPPGQQSWAGTIGATNVNQMVLDIFVNIVNGGSLEFNDGEFGGLSRLDLFIATIPNTIEAFEAENDDY